MMSLHEISLDSYSYFVKDITVVSRIDLICQGTTTFRYKILIHFRLPHLIQPVANLRTTVNPFLNKKPYVTWPLTSWLMLFSATQAKLLPESSDVEAKHPPLAVKSLRAH